MDCQQREKLVTQGQAEWVQKTWTLNKPRPAYRNSLLKTERLETDNIVLVHFMTLDVLEDSRRVTFLELNSFGHHWLSLETGKGCYEYRQ